MNNFGVGVQGVQFVGCDMVWQWCYIVVGGWVEFVGIDECQCFVQGFSYFFWGFDSMVGDIDCFDYYFFIVD